ncbi:MAG: response regulator transcription factor [Treponema sp.]|nr:response regulator transcription factor [Treponema sp.]
MGNERILIIEDDPEIQEMLKYSFAKEGWQLISALTGEEGIKQLHSGGADCVILDLMLPGKDGFRIIKMIREMENCKSLPVIMCTARGEDADIVAGLELGADDYVVKPYSPRVLAARIRAALRRVQNASVNGIAGTAVAEKKVFQHGKLKLDIEKHTVVLDDEPVDLFATEFAILAQFMSNPNVVFSRQKIINAVRGPDYPVTERSVDVQILGLRKKLKEAGEMIETIRSVGYRFTVE